MGYIPALLGALVLVLSGCAALDPQIGRMTAVDAVVAEALHASRASAAEQQAILSRAQKAFMAAATPANRLRLATLLASLPAPWRDEARAAELLEPIADSSVPGIGRFSALLVAQIAERQRMSRELERLARENERTARERDRVDKERDRREEALRQQLEALRSIERSIQEREEKLRRSQRSPPRSP
jgi:DNA repair exonuclease SbcCD ATPase subunit